ncbi:MAG: DUF4136 domain-containing protein [Deltaproteobacteria bacterium]|nr:DUF4136 domain-containing protein [Deltaproteobacteria bacterium]
MRRVFDRSTSPRLESITILLVLVGLTACQSFNVRSDWDDTVSFDGYQRYFWLEPPTAEGADPFADNDLLRKRVRKAIETQLAARGFRPVSQREDADFLVTYGVQLDEKIRVNGTTGVYGGYGGYGRWPIGFGSGIGTTDVRNYQEATLIVDFLNPDKEELVWRGWGSGFLQTRDRDRGQERFEAGVKAVLDAFPPRRPAR